MDPVIISAEGLSRQLRVTVPSSTIESKVQQRLAELAQTTKLPGFRVGKIPAKLLRQRYYAAIMQEELPKLADDATKQALDSLSVVPAYQPEVSLSADTGNPLEITSVASDVSFDVTLEIMPDIDLAKLEGIKVERPIALVTEAEVDEAVANLAENYRQYEEKPEGETASIGDKVNCASVAKRRDEDYAPLSTENQDFVLSNDSTSQLAQIYTALTGAKVGDVREVKIEQDSPNADEPKEIITVSLTVKKLSAPCDTTVDEMAQQIGLEGEVKLRSELRVQLDQQSKEQSDKRAERRLLDALSAAYDFELPKRLVEREINEIRSVSKQAQQQKHGTESADTDEDISNDEATALAHRRVRLGLLFMRFGQENKVSVTEDDIRNKIEQQAAAYGYPPEQLREFYSKDKSTFESQIQMPAYETKVVGSIMEHVSITDVTVSREELNREDPSPFDNTSESEEV